MFIALELKRSAKEQADPLQRHNLIQINEARGIGLVVSPANWKDVLEAIEILAKEGEEP